MTASIWQVFTENWLIFLQGLLGTLKYAFIAVAFGTILGTLISLLHLSKNIILRGIAAVYVNVLRGTPLLVQMYIAYFFIPMAVPFLSFMTKEQCVILSLVLNSSAYVSEIIRGGINAVDKGQTEAARSLGMSSAHCMQKIILPQALIVALRPYGNEIILMIKGSAIVAIVTVLDLMGETRRAFSRTFDYQAYLWAALIYLLIVELLRNLWAWLEQRLTRHLKR